MGYQGNKLVPAPNDKSAYANLNSIVDIEFYGQGYVETHSGDGAIEIEYVQILGRVTLFDGSKRDVALNLRRRETGAYELDPAVG